MIYPAQRFHLEQVGWENWKKIKSIQQSHVNTQSKVKHIREKVYVIEKRNLSQTPGSLLNIGMLRYAQKTKSMSPTIGIGKLKNEGKRKIEPLPKEIKGERHKKFNMHKNVLEFNPPNIFTTKVKKILNHKYNAFLSLSLDLDDEENLFATERKKRNIQGKKIQMRTTNIQDLSLIGINQFQKLKIPKIHGKAKRQIETPRPWIDDHENIRILTSAFTLNSSKHTLKEQASVGISTDI